MPLVMTMERMNDPSRIYDYPLELVIEGSCHNDYGLRRWFLESADCLGSGARLAESTNARVVRVFRMRRGVLLSKVPDDGSGSSGLERTLPTHALLYS